MGTQRPMARRASRSGCASTAFTPRRDSRRSAPETRNARPPGRPPTPGHGRPRPVALVASSRCATRARVASRFRSGGCTRPPTSRLVVLASADLRPTRRRGEDHGAGAFAVSAELARVWLQTGSREAGAALRPSFPWRVRRCSSADRRAREAKISCSPSSGRAAWTTASASSGAQRTVKGASLSENEGVESCVGRASGLIRGSSPCGATRDCPGRDGSHR